MLESIGVKIKTLGLILSMLLFSNGSLGEETPGKTAVPPADSKKKIFIQFENELVDGQRESPGVDYLFNRKEANYKKMMKLRENFLSEVKKGKRDFSGSK